MKYQILLLAITISFVCSIASNCNEKKGLNILPNEILNSILVKFISSNFLYNQKKGDPLISANFTFFQDNFPYAEEFVTPYYPMISKAITSIQIPPYSTKEDGATINLYNLQIVTCDFSTAQLGLQFLSAANGVSNGLMLQISNFNIAVQGDVKAKFLFISDSGVLTASSSGATLSIFMDFGSISFGKPVININSIQTALNDFSFKFSGNFFDKIVNYIAHWFSSDIKNDIINGINKESSSLTSQINKILQATDFSFHKDSPNVTISFNMSNVPQFFTNEKMLMEANAYIRNGY